MKRKKKEKKRKRKRKRKKKNLGQSLDDFAHFPNSLTNQKDHLHVFFYLKNIDLCLLLYLDIQLASYYFRRVEIDN